MKWATIDNEYVVVSIFESDTRPERSVKIEDGEECRVGLLWNGWSFVPRVFTAYAFLARFADAELETVRARAVTDPICWRFLTFATAAQVVDTSDPMTVMGMGYLVSIGILTAERRDEILSA